ncbi:MAG: TonB-dependent receptor [Elusimicrobia bacterium]|nr:TonB-dependent receptor [Elusimicrobiota bacterium]
MPRHRLSAVAVLSFAVSSAQSVPPLVVNPYGWKVPVTGSLRLPDAPSDSSKASEAVVVLDRGAIERSGARTLPELLSRQAGLDVFDSNGSAFQPTLDMRGFNAQPVPATAVVLDGVRINEADFGQVNWQLIPLQDVERVEVHPGPATLFGRGALAGVVLVTTRRADKAAEASAETGASYGSFNRRKGWASGSGAFRALDWRVHLERERESGWRDHSEGDIGTARVRAGWRPDAGTDLSLSYQRSDDRLNQGGSITGAELAADRTQHVSQVDTVSSLDMVTAAARKALPWGLSLTGSAHWRARHEATPQNKGRTTFSDSVSDLVSRGGVVQLTRAGEALDREVSVTAGLEGGRTESDSFTRSNFGPSGSLVKDDSAALFGQASVDLVPERLSATAGLRYDENRMHYEDKVKPSENGRTAFRRSSPRFGLAYNPAPGRTFYASYAEAFRAPTPNELKPFGVAFAAQMLNPVQTKQYEVGARLEPADGLNLAAAFFRSDALDEIYYDSSVGAFGANVNIPRVRRYGTEGSAAWQGERWDLRAGHAWTKAEFASQVTLSKAGNTSQKVLKGDSLPMVPEHKGTLGVGYAPARGWRVSADGTCVGSQWVLGDEANLEPTLPAYCTVDLGVRLVKGAWTASLSGTNVTDARYQARSILATLSGRAERFYTPAPGAGVGASLSWRWGPSGAGTARRPQVDALELARRAVAD